jgi:2'-5' RNA ligase
MMRTFLALELDEPLRAALAVEQFLLPLPRRKPVENLHLTLSFLGEQPDPVLEAVHEALLSLRLSAFALTLAGFGLFGGDCPRALYAAAIPDAPLLRLQHKVEVIARRAGAVIEARRFIPHVTLGRFRPPGLDAAMRLERAVVDRAGFRAGPMEVRDFVLYRSILSHPSPRYEVLARYPLESGSDART